MYKHRDGHIVRALTIAGSDCGGGAGIQADLKTFHQFEVYGMSAITALTAQNTVGVQGVHQVDAEFVRQQLLSVFDDLGADAIKTGMLANEDVIRTVADVLAERGPKHLVVDPVMVAKGGESLLQNSAVARMKSSLIPLCDVLTPNIPEASALCGYPLISWPDFHQAAEDLCRLGAKTVIIKGGHMNQSVLLDAPFANRLRTPVSVDIVYTKGQYTYFLSDWVESSKTHGTGCTFSAALTAMLAREAGVMDAVASAKVFISRAIAGAKSWDVGHGHGPTDHSAVIDATSGVEPGGTYLLNGTTWVSCS